MTRITNSMVVRTGLADAFRQRERLSIVQEQSASQLRINRPSDDPAGLSIASGLRAELAANEQYRANLASGSGRLRSVERAIDEAGDVIVRARELAIQGANGTLDADARRLLAQEIESLHAQLLANGNARHGGGYVFAGTASDAPAFVSSGPFVSGSPPPTVSFAGDSTELQFEIDDGVRVETSFDGRRVFLGDANGDSLPDAGREDVFAVLGDLWLALDTNDRDAVGATLGRLDRVQLQMELELARVGALDARLRSTGERHEKDEVDLKERLSSVQDADTLEVLSSLVSLETALEVSLDALARTLSPSLFDSLR